LQDDVDLEQGGCTIVELRFYNFDYEPSADSERRGNRDRAPVPSRATPPALAPTQAPG
jgi:hypothetical protein